MAHPARRLHQRLETIHAVTYFAEESHAAAADLGLKGFWMGYFAFRAAPLGPVGPPVVEAVFANFAPRRVRRALPDAWSHTTPEACLQARRDSAVAALRRVAPDELAAAPWVVDHLAEIVVRADHLGRPLFAANREQGVPDEPVAALWHLATCLREQRGDGHVAVQAASGLDPVEMHLIYAAGSGPPGELLRTTRDWTVEEWAEGVERLVGRGLLSDETTLTAEGEALHRHIEDTTDTLAARSLGDVDELVEGLTPLARAISGSGVLPFPNPVGVREA
jgi:Helix-turn-helix family